ncbi:hypothetical protein WR25_04471 [Diploscapter pachys]|uniref:guanylate cyclase n=1 Tax=Diploscapter pachys TaxID=2018661 RepID=A0A2A2LFU5_9BILA|nr:hypothetical protein WR25_04471 [Diploscapter pachys]
MLNTQENPVLNLQKYMSINEEADNVNELIDNVAKDIEVTSQVLVIGSDFVDLYGVLQKLDLHKISTRNFITVLVAPTGVLKITANDALRRYLNSAGVYVLAPIINISENFTIKISTSINATGPILDLDQIEEPALLYSACYAFCVARKKYDSDTVDNYYKTLAGQEYTNDLGTFKFDQNGVVLRDYQFMYLRNDKRGNDTVIMTVKAQYAETCGPHYQCFTVRGPGGKTTKPSSHETLTSKRRTITSYALMGTVKAEFLFYRQFKRIRWTKPELRYLTELKALNHDNITKFIGLSCNDSADVYILYGLVERATLEDFIYDSDFSLDFTFKSAFARDILRGLQYIHKSSIVAHGMLSVQTCMIDANWVLKLTNFGVSSLIHNFMTDGTLQCTTSIALEELLREIAHCATASVPRGTQKGDIYSLGMVLYQMVYRMQPFPKSSSAQELIVGIIDRRMKPERLEASAEENKLVDCIMLCFNEPEKRPKAREIANAVSTVYTAAKGNLVDQMIRMNEKYALNLEKLVKERTDLLVAAQEQTDRLLNEILPKSVAQVLKLGGVIPPRSYDSATVLFAQLCDFPLLVGKSGPDDVINFLNDVFDKFDNIIRKHDAYKVETTGETYMVVSGVPTENEGQHVFEIAEISLEIRETAMNYVVEHCPSFKVRTRIGFHAGPIAAGVIGIRSPRYCLFGDTVNFASRMQSNCPPSQIQTSEVTANILMKSEEYSLVQRGIVHVKGKGNVNCYWLNEHIHDLSNEEPEGNIHKSDNENRPKTTQQKLEDQNATPLPKSLIQNNNQS